MNAVYVVEINDRGTGFHFFCAFPTKQEAELSAMTAAVRWKKGSTPKIRIAEYLAPNTITPYEP